MRFWYRYNVEIVVVPLLLAAVAITVWWQLHHMVH